MNESHDELELFEFYDKTSRYYHNNCNLITIHKEAFQEIKETMFKIKKEIK
mgnify:CR=1 FL=1